MKIVFLLVFTLLGVDGLYKDPNRKCYVCDGDQCDDPKLEPCDKPICMSIDFPLEQTGYGRAKYCAWYDQAKHLCGRAKEKLRKAHLVTGVCYYCEKSGCNKGKQPPPGATVIVNEAAYQSF